MDDEAWNARYAGRELVWGAGPNRFLVEEAEGLSPGRALDLAAGEGRNAIWLGERGFEVLAVDFSRVGCEKAAALAEARGVEIAWKVADLLRYDPEPAAFDLVLLMYLHLPWPDMQVVLRRAATAVAPGGTLLLVGHDADNLERGHGGPPDPAILYSAAQVAGELGPLTIEKAEQVTREVATDDGPATAIDCIVRAVHSKK